jgi:hypothetical protein
MDSRTRRRRSAWALSPFEGLLLILAVASFGAACLSAALI